MLISNSFYLFYNFRVFWGVVCLSAFCFMVSEVSGLQFRRKTKDSVSFSGVHLVPVKVWPLSSTSTTPGFSVQAHSVLSAWNVLLRASLPVDMLCHLWSLLTFGSQSAACTVQILQSSLPWSTFPKRLNSSRAEPGPIRISVPCCPSKGLDGQLALSVCLMNEWLRVRTDVPSCFLSGHSSGAPRKRIWRQSKPSFCSGSC